MTDPIQAAVTGREDPIDPREPADALAEFYRAFNSRDLALMTRAAVAAGYFSDTFSSRFFMSSACSSSTLRMSSMSLRVVGSSSPSQRTISE